MSHQVSIFFLHYVAPLLTGCAIDNREPRRRWLFVRNPGPVGYFASALRQALCQAARESSERIKAREQILSGSAIFLSQKDDLTNLSEKVRVQTNLYFEIDRRNRLTEACAVYGVFFYFVAEYSLGRIQQFRRARAVASRSLERILNQIFFVSLDRRRERQSGYRAAR